MKSKKLPGGVIIAILLLTAIVLSVTAGGKQEKSEGTSPETEQKAESESSQETESGEEDGGTPITTGGQSDGTDSEPAAVVEGEPIPKERVERFVQAQQMQYMQQGQQIQGQQLEQMRGQVLDYLIDQEVLYQIAEEEGYTASDEQVEQQISQFKQQAGGEEEFNAALEQQGMSPEDLEKDIRKQVVLQQFIQENFESGISVSDEEARDFYEENPDYFTQQEQVEAKHILVSAEEDASEEEVEEAREKIEDIQDELESGKDFEEVARESSEGPSAEDGGSLGFIQKGQMVPEFEETAFSLQSGETSDIIRTQFGFHIVKVTDRKEEELSPFEDVKSDIVNHLKSIEMDSQVQDFLEEKKANMDIERFTEGE
ncbi:MAG: peptidylprolyl isomerase [Spirochaetaceae bacterium]